MNLKRREDDKMWVLIPQVLEPGLTARKGRIYYELHLPLGKKNILKWRAKKSLRSSQL
jgi:hypothetical protein